MLQAQRVCWSASHPNRTTSQLQVLPRCVGPANHRPSNRLLACRASSHVPASTPPPSQPTIDVPSVSPPQRPDSDDSSRQLDPLRRAIAWLRACIQGIVLTLLPTLQQRKRLTAGVSMVFVSTLMVAAGVVGVASRPPSAPSPPREVVYSQFRDLLTQGQVRAVRFDEASARIYFDTLASTAAATTVQGTQRGSLCWVQSEFDRSICGKLWMQIVQHHKFIDQPHT